MRVVEPAGANGICRKNRVSRIAFPMLCSTVQQQHKRRIIECRKCLENVQLGIECDDANRGWHKLILKSVVEFILWQLAGNCVPVDALPSPVACCIKAGPGLVSGPALSRLKKFAFHLCRGRRAKLGRSFLFWLRTENTVERSQLSAELSSSNPELETLLRRRSRHIQ